MLVVWARDLKGGGEETRRRRRKNIHNKIIPPITTSRQRHTLSPQRSRKNFRGQSPRHRTPRGSKGKHVEK